MTIDLSLSEAQTLLQKTAHDFFAESCPPRVVRALEASESGYSVEMWTRMAELGWLGVTFPERYDGSGGSFLDLYPICEEMGRFLVPGPFLDTLIAGETLLSVGSDAQKEQILRPIAAGKLVVSAAVLEPSGEYGPEGVTLSATVRDGAYVLNGVKLPVAYALSAGYLLCAARTSGEDGPDGISLFLVDRRSPGLSFEPLPNIASYPLFAVTFSDVVAPAESLVGPLDAGWSALEAVLTKVAVLQAAMILGAADRVLELTTAYTKDRVQFGQPIGRYQAVQYLVTDILLDAHLARLLTLQAAWRIDAGLDCRREAVIAKAAASKASAHLMRQAHEAHAGVAFMMEHDLQLYSRRAKHWEVNLGDARYNQELVAAAAGL